MGNRWWAVLFGVMMTLCGGLFIYAPIVGWWMPRGESTHAAEVDFLFYVILYVTGFFFILTEALLVIFMFKYAGRPEGSPPAERTGFEKAMAGLLSPVTRYLNSPHRVELAWTVVPAVILLYIAFAQVGAWARIKYYSHAPELSVANRKTQLETDGIVKVPIQVGVSARQFEWRVRYPSVKRMEDWLSFKNQTNEKELAKIAADHRSFAKNPQADDIHTVNTIHIFGDWYTRETKGGRTVYTPAAKGTTNAVWKADPALVQLTTIDVLHSFNIPSLRVKQDALPGKTIAVWFTPLRWNTNKNDNGRWEDGYNPRTNRWGDEEFTWEIPCAELCGWGHYRMIGKLFVHETQQDYLDWLKDTQEKEEAHSR